MKTVLKFLYIIVVFFAIMLIQQSGGAAGMRMAQYVTNNFHQDHMDPDYTVSIISGVYGVYGDANHDNWTDIRIITADGRFSFTLTLIPFGGTRGERFTQDRDGERHVFDIRDDGFFIFLSCDEDNLVDFFSVNLYFDTININTQGEFRNPQPITIQRMGVVGTQVLPLRWGRFSYIEHVLQQDIIAQYGPEPLHNQNAFNSMNFANLGDYNIFRLHVSVNVRDYYGVLQNEPIFVGSEPGFASPHPPAGVTPVEWETNVISEELMLFSARQFPVADYANDLYLPTISQLDELNEAKVVLFVYPDLSPYWWWYLIIWGIYVLLALVIPYFWMFRKPLKEALAVRRESKNRQQIAKQKAAGGAATSPKKFKTVQEGQKIKEQQKQGKNNVNATPVVDSSPDISDSAQANGNAQSDETK